MKQSILVTGGLGYVGGRVGRHLARDSAFEVYVTSRDPDSTDLPEWFTKDRCLKLDLLSDTDIGKVCKGIDTVIHFAALNEIDSARDPDRAFLVNGLGTQKLVRSALAAGVNRFIYFSTAHIYGSPLEGVITEDTLPRPVHPYAITHRTAEDAVLAATRPGSFRGVVIRLSNSLGAPINTRVNRWSLIANDLCRQAVTTREMRLKTSGLQERDFIPLEDVARAVSHVIRLPEHTLGKGIFNLGGERTLSVIHLADLIQDRCQEILGFRPPVIRPDFLPNETLTPLFYSIQKLKSTGFCLKGTLEKEIDDTLLFCRDHYSDT